MSSINVVYIIGYVFFLYNVGSFRPAVVLFQACSTIILKGYLKTLFGNNPVNNNNRK